MKARAMTQREVESLLRWLEQQVVTEYNKSKGVECMSFGVHYGASAMAHDTIKHLGRVMRRKARK